MRSRLLQWLVFSGMWLTAPAVRAESIILRGVLPNPAGDEALEWIALENTSTATVSGSGYWLRDTKGVVVEFPLTLTLGPGEIQEIPRSISGITLNNDEEEVELLLHGEVRERSGLIAHLAEEVVWTKLSSGWKGIPLPDWQLRARSRNWAESETSSPNPMATSPLPSSHPPAKVALVSFSPCHSPEWIELQAESAGQIAQLSVEDATGTVVEQQDLFLANGERKRVSWSGAKLSNAGEWFIWRADDQEMLVEYPACQGSAPFLNSAGQWQQESLSSSSPTPTPGPPPQVSPPERAQPLASVSATLDYRRLLAPPRLLTRQVQSVQAERSFANLPVPEPDYDQEERNFQNWKRRSLLGATALILGGVLLILPCLLPLWRWYNEQRDPW